MDFNLSQIQNPFSASRITSLLGTRAVEAHPRVSCGLLMSSQQESSTAPSSTAQTAPSLTSPPKSFSTLSFVAGAVSGAAGQAVGHPLDTLNIHAQAGRSAEHLSLRSLWRGAAVPVATVGGINSLALGVFENVRRLLWPYESATPLPHLAAAGAVCGLCASSVTCPLSRVKILQQLTPDLSFVAGMRYCLQSGTVFRAYPTAALWESTRGSYMVIYALLKRAQQPPPSPNSRVDGELPLWSRLIAGGGANVLNIGVWYPLNTVLHVQQSELPPDLARKVGAPPAEPRGMLATARGLLSEDGVRRLYRGFGYAVLRAGPVAAVILPCFEVVLPRLEQMTSRVGLY